MAIKLSDEVLSMFVPVIVYWVFSGIYGGLLGYRPSRSWSSSPSSS